MTPEEAGSLIDHGEGQTTEFKRSFAEEKRAIESLCAFANADGGTVLFGVAPNGNVVGASIGVNTLENFASRIAAHSQPPLCPRIEIVSIRGKDVAVTTVDRAGRAQLFYAFNVALIRVGRTNQVMSPDQQRARLLQGQDDWSEERDRPRFEVTQASVARLETAFVPQFTVRHFSGGQIAHLEWRFRGPRFAMDWRQASGGALDRTHFTQSFDLSQPPQDDPVVGTNEMGLEIRFYWRGRWRAELHRWPITRRELPTKVMWEVGSEILPSLQDEQTEADQPATVAVDWEFDPDDDMNDQ
jgi:hypothetical protein